MKRFVSFSAALATIGLSACAVLEVKVDVYKGPLASHDEVISQRVAASMIGIQSDLLRLRQQLSDDPKTYLAGFCSLANDQRYLKIQGAAALPPHPEISLEVFDRVQPARSTADANRKRFACEIDALLDLFEPIEGHDPLLSEFQRRAAGTWNKARVNIDRFDRNRVPDRKQKDEEIAGQLWDIWKSAPESPRGQLAYAYSCFLSDNVGNQEYCVYDDYAGAGYRIWETVFVCAAAIDELKGINAQKESARTVLEIASSLQIDSASAELLGQRSGRVSREDSWKGCLDYGNNDAYSELDYQIGSNLGFDALTDESVVQRHASFLFSNPIQARDFASSVAEISASFLRVREAQEQYFEDSLEFLEEFLRSERIQSSEYEAVFKSVSEVTLLLIDNAYLADAVCLARREHPEIVARFRAVADASFQTAVQQFCAPNEIDFDDYAIRYGLKNSLDRNPLITINLLSDLHDLYRFTPQRTLMSAFSGTDRELSEHGAAKRIYGLTKGPSLKSSEDSLRGERKALPTLGSDELWQAFAEAVTRADRSVSESSAIENHARYPEGLWKLVEDFVNTSDGTIRSQCADASDCRQLTTAKDVAQQRLLTDIVRFADKTLALANSAHEFENYGRQNALPGFSDDHELYAIVLQRIGNTAMAILDDMYARADYDAAQRANAQTERDAILRTFGGDASSYYQRLRQDVATRARGLSGSSSGTENELKRKQAAAKATSDAFDAALKACQAQAENISNLLVLIDRPASKPDLTVCPEEGKTVSAPSAYSFARIESLWRQRYSDTLKDIQAVPESPVRAAIKGAQLGDGETKASDLYGKMSKLLSDATPAADSDKAAFELAKARALSVFNDAAFKAGTLTRLTNVTLPSGDGQAAEHMIVNAIIPELDARQKAYAQHARLVSDISGLQAALATASQAKAASAKAVSDQEASNTKASNKAQLANQALAKIDAVRTPVLNQLGAVAPEAVTPRLVQTTVAAQIAAEGDASAAIAKYIAGLPELPAVPGSVATAMAETKNASTAKEVLDGLISALRYEHVRAVRHHGEESEVAKYAQEALEAAYRQRSDQIYLRPAISYLRTSFASSALGDNAIRWRNSLSEQTLRSIPLLGPFIENGAFNPLNNSNARLRILEGNDTQFWQNVNNVRVSGNGATNYVVTKDDIGNWYVRGYDTSQEVIAKSMGRLALFNVGAPGATILDSGSTTGTNAQANVSTPIERAYDNRLAAFDKSTDLLYETLKGQLETSGEANQIAASIRSAWAANDQLSQPRKLKETDTTDPVAATAALNPVTLGAIPTLNSAATNMAAEVKAVTDAAASASPPQSAAAQASALRNAKSRAILQGLRALRSYHDQVASGVSSLSTLKPAEGDQRAEKEVALELLASTMGARLRSEIEKREGDIEDLQTMSSILADSLSGQ